MGSDARRLVLPGLALVAVVVVSGFMMRYFEDGPFKARQQYVVDAVETACVLANLTDGQRKVLQHAGVLLKPQRSPWSLWGSCFFCLTAVTTIGYGAYVPVTTEGRVYTVLFTITGMILVGYTFANLAAVLVAKFFYLAKTTALRLNDKRVDAHGKLTEYGERKLKEDFDAFDKTQTQSLTESELEQFLRFHNDGREVSIMDIRFVLARADQSRSGCIEFEELKPAVEAWYEIHPVEPRHITQSHIFIALSLCCLSTLTSSCLYHMTERWSPADAAWFAFVSMTTVGFGDMMPETPAGQALVYFFIMLDLGMLAYLISAVAEYMLTDRTPDVGTPVGKLEALPVDTTGDGVVDHVFIDTTGDGKHDQAFPVRGSDIGITPASPVFYGSTDSVAGSVQSRRVVQG
eukprot:TRINITY_DN1123_c0_g1_i1.p1 TRINITY_DN1123_c0_g1~~TRINITY_DN1123_c0_g1_i1.p1  ORF type:complete len:420 (+),score=152.91 TRINITY_DN1123_c0_g1_i1:51-1262(+)